MVKGTIRVKGIEGTFSTIEEAKAAMSYSKRDAGDVPVPDSWELHRKEIRGGIYEAWAAPGHQPIGAEVITMGA